MTREQALAAGRDWLAQVSPSLPGFSGAYVSGSFLELAPGAPWPPDSDLDLVLLAAEPLPQAHKISHQGVVIEATYLSPAELSDLRHVLTTHYLAYALSHGEILSDPRNLLRPLADRVREEGGRPQWVRARWRAVLEEMRRACADFPASAPLHQRAMAWLFTAGKAPFPALIAAGRNCTVRKRCGAARAALDSLDLTPLMEPILRPLLGESFHPACLPAHVEALSRAFDAACRSRGPSASYRFRGDISPDARAFSVDWCRGMLSSPHPEDCVFWLGATYARCLTVLWMDENSAYYEALPGLAALLQDLSIPSEEVLSRRMAEIPSLLPGLEAVAEEALNPAR